MNLKQIKYDLQNLISGKSGASYDALIQTVASHLRSGKRTSPMAEEKHQNKAQETEELIGFAKSNNLILEHIPEENFIASGAEQKVYITGEKYVIKLNDAIYYASWEDYFYNLLLHNYFFADTAYHLLGFYLSDGTLYAVVQQSYIKADSMTNLKKVNDFMTVNGFENRRRHDYENVNLGLIIEDLHDENVLTYDGLLYFIDTVFFIKPDKFWN
ncbi:MAG: hypothetical protein L3K26_00740 [Candidatus Hydrogenedentes bacterium]|nr:hypothetical protein [Candidatus Hydrogenedentota bacterium]